MHDFCYVSKKEAAPVKAELLDIIHEVQDIVRDDFTFQFTFIGSSSRNMITYDRKSNIGFDFDVNIEVNDDDENYEPKEIRTIIRKALDKVARQYGYDYCEDSTQGSFTVAISQSSIIAVVEDSSISDTTRTIKLILGNTKAAALKRCQTR